MWTILTADSGTESPHRSSTSRSTATILLGSISSRASKARCRRPPSRTGTSPSRTSSGPRIPNRMSRGHATSVARGRLPGGYRPLGDGTQAALIPAPQETSPMHRSNLIIRVAKSADAAAIARLVELEEAPPLTGDALVAELDGTIIAALSMRDGRAVADPFRPTAATVRMLRHWRTELIGARARRAPAARRSLRPPRIAVLRRTEAWS